MSCNPCKGLGRRILNTGSSTKATCVTDLYILDNSLVVTKSDGSKDLLPLKTCEDEPVNFLNATGKKKLTTVVKYK